MATKNDEVLVNDPLTIAVPKKEVRDEGPRVSIFLPKLEEEDGLKVDQYEHVTLSNEMGGKKYLIQRGVPNDVSVPVFMALKEKYPYL